MSTQTKVLTTKCISLKNITKMQSQVVIMADSDLNQFLEILRQKAQSATSEQKQRMVESIQEFNLVFNAKQQFFGPTRIIGSNISIEKFLAAFFSTLKEQFGEEVAIEIIKEIAKSAISEL